MSKYDYKKYVPEKLPKNFFRFLIVDDEQVTRKLLRSILKTQEYTAVDEAESGEAALDALSQNEYHVVLLDKNMPGKDGMEVLERGKAVRPDCEFLIITAYGSMETAMQAMDLGAYSYITKPFSEVDVIIKRVEGALEKVTIRRKNEILVDRLKMFAGELDKTSEELTAFRSQFQKLQKGNEQEPGARVNEAVSILRKMVSQLDLLTDSSSGKTANVFSQISRGLSVIADMLARGSANPRGSDR
jgi:YesN/AraC family two-component response regulator